MDQKNIKNISRFNSNSVLKKDLLIQRIVSELEEFTKIDTRKIEYSMNNILIPTSLTPNEVATNIKFSNIVEKLHGELKNVDNCIWIVCKIPRAIPLYMLAIIYILIGLTIFYFLDHIYLIIGLYLL